MVTENVQDTTKVQVNYKVTTEMPFSISWLNSTYFNESELHQETVNTVVAVNVDHILCLTLKS